MGTGAWSEGLTRGAAVRESWDNSRERRMKQAALEEAMGQRKSAPSDLGRVFTEIMANKKNLGTDMDPETFAMINAAAANPETLGVMKEVLGLDKLRSEAEENRARKDYYKQGGKKSGAKDKSSFHNGRFKDFSRRYRFLMEDAATAPGEAQKDPLWPQYLAEGSALLEAANKDNVDTEPYAAGMPGLYDWTPGRKAPQGPPAGGGMIRGAKNRKGFKLLQ